MSRIALRLPVAIVAFVAGVIVYNASLLQVWWKQDNVRVLYAGQPQTQSSVYRSSSGDLFVTLVEPYPDTGYAHTWHYFIQPQESVGGIAYHGKLVTWRGEHAFDREYNPTSRLLFSTADAVPNHPKLRCRGNDCVGVNFGSNFVEFPSVYFEDTGAIIRLSW